MGVTIRELFVEPPEAVRDWIAGPTRSPLALGLSPCSTGCCARPSRFFRPGARRRAIDKAVAFVTERLNGEDGLGGIFPAMANSLMMFDCLGYPPDHPDLGDGRGSAIDKLLVHGGERSYCQPCLSPVWDTALACHALMEAGEPPARAGDRAGARLARRTSRCWTSSATGR